MATTNKRHYGGRPVRDLERWEVGERSSVPASKLITGPDDKLGIFFLSLAVAFNDLKGLVRFERYLLSYGRPAKGQLSAYAGEWRGLHVQIHRWIAGVLEEAMKVIRVEGIGVMDTPEFAALVASMKERHRDAWSELVEIAKTEREKKKPKEGTRGRLLYDVRNCAGFHYLGNELAPAYAAAFDPSTTKLQPVPPDGGMTAYYTAGDNMETTRFFFGDAAVQHRMLSAGIRSTRADTEIVELAKHMNDALGVLIAKFAQSRGGTVS